MTKREELMKNLDLIATLKDMFFPFVILDCLHAFGVTRIR